MTETSFPQGPSAAVPPVNARGRTLTGIGGWLALLVFILVIVTPLSSFALILSYFSAELGYPQLASSSAWTTYKAASTLFMLAVAGLSVYGGNRLSVKRSPAIVEETIRILWIVGPLAAMCLLGLIPILVLGTLSDRFYSVAFLSTVWAGSWTAYLIGPSE